jgi:hypothetical protein
LLVICHGFLMGKGRVRAAWPQCEKLD